MKTKCTFMIIIALLLMNPLYSENLNNADEEITRHSVPEKLANPKRIKTDNLLYLKLGYGGLIGNSIASGVGFGIGYRHEMDNMAIDVSFGNSVIGQEYNDGGSFELIRLQGLYFFSPLSNSSFYTGAGLGYLFSGIDDNEGDSYFNHGLNSTLTLGFETMRLSSVRMFFQLDATIPFYLNEGEDEVNGNTLYSPVISFSMGMGF